MERQKTNSVTYLVKVIATEVFEEKINGLIEEKIKELRTKPRTGVNAGQKWTPSADSQLRQAMRDFICEMAHEHGRTYGSIRDRLKMYITKPNY